MTTNITGKITGIKYVPLLGKLLLEYDFAQFDINKCPMACVVHDGKYTFALSKWRSLKRSRTYPFSGVYNSLNHSKKITVIPVLKDEGQAGDCDYLQWDTVSLMSLMDVFVVFTYYEGAEVSAKYSDKIAKQRYDSLLVNTKIKEIEQYHSSALHWNLNELNTNFYTILDRAEQAYQNIAKQTGVPLHMHRGLEVIKNNISKNIADFMAFSRAKSEQAQKREAVTVQPKESLQSLSKATITIVNYLGGAYFLTVDEVETVGKSVILTESKHSKKEQLPRIGDIKDGLLKMALFGNLSDVMVDNYAMKSTAKLVLTSPFIQDKITSNDSEKNIRHFFDVNGFRKTKQQLLKTLFDEANQNNFVVEICYRKNNDANDKKPLALPRR